MKRGAKCTPVPRNGAKQKARQGLTKKAALGSGFFGCGQLLVRRLLQLAAVIATAWGFTLRLLGGLPRMRIFVDLF